ncbi:MAG: tetratricopeptide repeat protein [Chitinophagaceae bacterium]
MNKQQIILIGAAVALAGALYFFGETVPKKKEGEDQAKAAPAHNEVFEINHYIEDATKILPVSGQQQLASLENEVKRGDVKAQQIKAYRQQAAFWRDSANNPVAYFHYLKLASALESSEKSLTFAAHSILRYLPYAEQPAERVFLANEARELFEKALDMNPANDSSAIGLGGCYMYGASAGEGDSPMTGISKVREVATRDSTNIFAQYMLGVGGIISGQLDKAVVRFEKVAAAEPDNIELLFKLAEAYENLGDKPNAIKWYTVILGKSNIPEMKKELAARIKQLGN